MPKNKLAIKLLVWTVCALLITLSLISLINLSSAQVYRPPAASLSTGDITSNLILDGTISNADVSSTAAIAISKIATSTSYDFVSSGTQTIAGAKTFSSAVTLPAGTPSGNQAVSKSYLDTVNGLAQLNASSGEGITANDAVYLNTSSATSSATSTAAGATPYCYINTITQSSGAPPQGAMCAQPFRLQKSAVITSVSASIKQSGTPTGDFGIYIAQSSGGNPSSTYSSIKRVSSTAIGTTDKLIEFTLDSSFTATAGTDYWIVSTTTEAQSDTNNYLWGSTAAGLGSSTGKVFTSGAWASANGQNMAAGLNFTYVPGRIYQTNAATAAQSNNFLGFANAAVEPAVTVVINTGGCLNTFSTLNYGQQYLTNTNGAIAIASGTVQRKVGIGVSSSTLCITNIW